MNMKNMDKTTIVNTFLGQVDNLRNNAKLSQKEKVVCFQQIAECILHPSMEAHINYATHCSSATNILLLFCEDLDSTVRMSAEENLNKIFRALEKTRVSRILMDLYGEIKRNGNQRSLRICLNLFAHYAPRIKERHVRWYALRLLACIQTIAQRKEPQLSECLCDFIKNFGRNLQHGLTDSETYKMFEVLIANIGVECAVKRRCSAQNFITLIENSRNKNLMARHGLNKVIELLLSNQEQHCVLGVLGCLRLLVPLIIRGFPNDANDDDDDDDDDDGGGGGDNDRYDDDDDDASRTKSQTNKINSKGNSKNSNKNANNNDREANASSFIPNITNECRQIIEIYDYCLHLLSTSNAQQQHGIINAALEVINAILQTLDCSANTTQTMAAKSLHQLLSNQQLQHNEYLRKRKSLKNQIFQQSRNYEDQQQSAKIMTMMMMEENMKDVSSQDDVGESDSMRNVEFGKYKEDPDMHQYIRYSARSISECVDDDMMAIAEAAAAGAAAVATGTSSSSSASMIMTTTTKAAKATKSVEHVVSNIEDVEDDDFTKLLEINEPQHTKCKNEDATLDKMKQQRCARTTHIDVDNLIDAIDGTSIDDNTNVNNKNLIPDRQNLLTTSAAAEAAVATKTTTPESTTTINNSLTVNEGGEGASAALNDDKSSQHLSDFDNESFNSIDFDAEITFGGAVGTDAMTPTRKNAIGDETAGGGDGGETKSSSDAIGSFFNNLISHSSAASESVTKLFRPASLTSSSSKMTPTKSQTQSDKGDAVSLTSVSAADSLSLISTASDNKHFDVDAKLEEDSANYVPKRQNSNNDDSYSRTVSVTASTAILADSETRNTTAPDCSSIDDEREEDEEPRKMEVELRRIPNVNPFLRETSPLKQTVAGGPLITLEIGTIFEQPLLYYTARCIAARFLLTGDSQNRLQNDVAIRISIKSLSLSVIAQCVRLAPQVLQLQLEISLAELRSLQMDLEQVVVDKSSSSPSPDQAKSDDRSDSSHIGIDYDHVDDVAVGGCDLIDFSTESTNKPLIDFSENNTLLLDIKDDHFGESTSNYFLNQPLSRSADPVMLSQQMNASPLLMPKKLTASTTASSTPSSNRLTATAKNINTSLLSKSDIVITAHGKVKNLKITKSDADAPPTMLPPRPPKRTKSMRKNVQSNKDFRENKFTTLRHHESSTTQRQQQKQQQFLSDILLLYNHADPMLRGGVQQIIGNFLQSSKAGLSLRLTLNLQHLLAILLKGLQDEIHTVIIQALNVFDKIFPHVLSKYLTEPPSCHYAHQRQQQRRHAEEKQTFYAKPVEIVDWQCDVAGGSNQTAQQMRHQKQHTHHQHTRCANDTLCATHECCSCCCCCCCSSRQTAETTRKLLFSDNDELIDALLNTFQLQSKCIDNNNDGATGSVSVGTTGVGSAATATAASFTTSTSSCAALTSTSFRSASGAVSNAASHNHCKYNTCSAFFISPKLLLDKLSLCYHNKYWLVQNKYAEVVSNLNYAALRTYYEQNGNANYELNAKDAGNPQSQATWTSESNTAAAAAGMGNNNHCDGSSSSSPPPIDFVSSDIVCTFETRFLDEILQLIGDSDVRVRSHAAECLCRYIIQNAKQHIPPESDLQNKIPITISQSQSQSQSTPAAASAFPNNSNNQNGANQKVYCKETFQTNLNLVWDLFDYGIFSGLPTTMRNLFKVNATVTPPLIDQISMANGGGISANAAYENAMTYAVPAMSRNTAEEEKVLAKVLYRITNRLMTLNDKYLQFGIIYTLRLLLEHFNFVDFHRAWMEFNFMEICMKFSYYNHTTAVDLSCQYDLIDVTGKLMAGAILVSPQTQQQQKHQQQIEQLLTHIMKIINIYYHLFTNQKPLLFLKAQKGDLFTNSRELAIVQSIGYFGNDYVYIKLYNILRSANDSYKISINPDSGSLLISLLKICLNTLSLCLELRAHSIHTPTLTTANDATSNVANFAGPPPNVLKLIEETLQYLGKVINYASSECIVCLRQLLKYLFGQNYGSRHRDYLDAMVRAYFGARVKGQNDEQLKQKPWQRNEQFKYRQNEESETINSSTMAMAAARTAAAAAASTSSVTGSMTSYDGEEQQCFATPPTTTTTTTSAAIHSIPLQRNLIETHENYDISGLTTSTVSPAMLSPSTSPSLLLSLSALSTLPENRLFAEMFVSSLTFHAWRSEREGAGARYIKLFERLVIYCLTLFMKSNAQLQAPILELLSQLLDLNVTYSILDSKNVIFEQVLKNLELIESGNARNAHIIIPPMMKFLVQLTHKSDRKLITIPKIISITNNLLANSTIRDCAVLALKALTYEIFFISPSISSSSPTSSSSSLLSSMNNAAANSTGITSVTSIGQAQGQASASTPTPTPPMQLSSSSSSPMSTSSHKPIEHAVRAPFQSPIARSPMATPQPLSRQQHHNVEERTAAAAIAAEAILTQQRELDTQKEVILGMLDKFIDTNVCQQVLCLMLLREQCSSEVELLLELNADKILRTGRTVGGGGVGGAGDIDGSISVTDEGHDYSRRTIQSMVSILPDSAAVYAIICHAMSDGRIRVRDWNDFFVLNTIFRNYGKSALANSKEFLALLQLFITKDVRDFSDLSYATIILANIIQKTEEIYLVNHIKLYLKNQPMVMEWLQKQHHPTTARTAACLVYDLGLLPLQDGPSTSSAATAKAKAAARITGEGSDTISEIKYFAKVLCEKLDGCLATITDSLDQAKQRHRHQRYPRSGHSRLHRLHHGDAELACFNLSHYYRVAVRFVSALYDVCCSSRHKDALQSVFRLVLAESHLLDKYYNLLMMGGDIADAAIGRCDNAVDNVVGYGDLSKCYGDGDGSGDGDATVALMLLQLELFKLLSAVKLLDPWAKLQQIQTISSLKWNVPAYVRRRVFQAIIAAGIDQKRQKSASETWMCSTSSSSSQQVLELCSDVKLSFLIADVVDAEYRAFICDLCQVDVKFCSLLLSALLRHASAVKKRFLRALLQLLLRISKLQRQGNNEGTETGMKEMQIIEVNAKIIAILATLHRMHESSTSASSSSSADRLLRLQLLRAAFLIFAEMRVEEQKAICECIQQLELNDEQSYACFLFLNNVNSFHSTIMGADMDARSAGTEVDQRIIDEEWLFAQLIKFSAQSDCDLRKLVKILLEVQSENKLHKIFENEVFDVARVLPHAIAGSMDAMLAAFRNDCIQHNPHIHYMQPNPLVRVACAALMARIELSTPAAGAASYASELSNADISMERQEKKEIATLTYLAKSVTALMESIERIEATALIYIEARLIEKFVREQLLQRDQIATLLRFLGCICMSSIEMLEQQQQHSATTEYWQEIRLLMKCIGKMLEQPLIWNELNQIERPIANSSSDASAGADGAGGGGNSGSGGGAAAGYNILTFHQRSLLLCKLLDLLAIAAAHTMQNTIFYRQYKMPPRTSTAMKRTTKTITSSSSMMQSALSDAAAAFEQLNIDDVVEGDENSVAAVVVETLLHTYAPKAIFVAKLIETKIDVDASAGILSAAYITGCCSAALKAGNSGANGRPNGGGGGGGHGTTLSSATICAEFECLQSAFGARLPLNYLVTIGISILRTNQFYAFAVTPFEIVQQQQREEEESLKQSLHSELSTPGATPERRRQRTAKTAGSGKMPTIPVESLSDVDVLRKFIKRLSIFGFTTRQQFEEYFMTFLLLINKIYDENMVDIQEQYHIKSACLQAILELLITYKSFPIVGNKVATHFYHTPRWSRINCDSIGLKKLHKVQLLIAESNVFYHPNLERQLATTLSYPQSDTIIGTGHFQPNQYDLNFIWQQMEAYAHSTISPTGSDGGHGGGDFTRLDQAMHAKNGSGRVTIIHDGQNKERRLSGEDNATKNFRYFTKQSGIDFKSSSQLIFDVLMQLIEHNHYLVLPNLVKFVEICESRDQIKEIKERIFKLQEIIPLDDPISHQHIIYLLCKTQAMLIPTHAELNHLSALISTYLKSSHTFVRNSTLQGLLCLLECCSKTNTTIGKLSEELALLRDLILGYINRHGIIDESPIQCSDTHSKLVWTLNYCLIEWTTKFVPQCHLVSNTIIAANNFLRKTNNENVYLCVLHGLERLVVIGNNGYVGTQNATGGIGKREGIENAGCIVTPLLRHKIEKLALDLVKLENEKFSIPALKLLVSCMYMGSSKQLENTELSNGIVQDDPEIIAQQTDKVDILLHCIKSSTRDAAWIYGQVLCQIIRDLVPPNEILTKVIKEFLAINQPHCDVIAMIVYQVFRCAIDSSFLQMLQDWLICSLPTFLTLPVQKGVWGLSVIFLSASINLHLIKLFPLVVALYNAGLHCGSATATTTTATKTTLTTATTATTTCYGAARDLRKLGQHEIALFVTAAKDFHAKLSTEQKMRFRDAFKKFQQHKVYAKMLQSL